MPILVAALVACGGGAQQGAPSPTQQPSTPRLAIAFVTHQAPGDTFWDLVRRGAEAAAVKDGVDLHYVHDPEAAGQARLVEQAVAEGVSGIAVTLPDPPALSRAVATATAAGISVVALNVGIDAWRPMGLLGYFGQDDGIAGEAVGERLSHEGARNALCVIQQPGHTGLQARCAGVASRFDGLTTTIEVDGTQLPAAQAAIVTRLQRDRGIDRVITLGAPMALTALKALGEANSYARLATFDTNAAVVEAIKRGTIAWAVDQQPYLQGYLAVDALWLYTKNRNVIGGGLPTLTGPSFIDESNVDAVAERASEGTR